ncbi:hypothetical protein HJC23_000640 [Cyclotella cryptica]|uniref:non-specific serine/threonine protein kinase n=1 Tax=Cyclotella cryptica TaxID=29204 RepID=A0ABD3Q6Y5_9STRA|eukprot:CCRYP_008044-RA/>CCRYP_008044-RA protein AED:0.18 eAED:0.18 QI:316/1/1/1/0.66/0.5/4/1796/942
MGDRARAERNYSSISSDDSSHEPNDDVRTTTNPASSSSTDRDHSSNSSPIAATPPTGAAASSAISPQDPNSSSTHHERQTLLLMLLAQVCSLHDATPRTFVVHVLALFERGILDYNSIQFLFDLGLVPKVEEVEGALGQFNISRNESCANQLSESQDMDSNQFKNCNDVSRDSGDANTNLTALAIVPYCPDSHQHPWSQSRPPLPLSQELPKRQTVNDKSKEFLTTRQKEVTAIRKHLERHESIDSSTQSGVFGSASAGTLPGVARSTNTSTTASNGNKCRRADSNATQNTLTSAEESFDAAPSMPPDGNAPKIHVQPTSTQQLANVRRMSSSLWSVEHHPLSLSRYQRDFHQVSLLATGSFGSVYHAIHKLEHRPYAVKCVTFSTTGYYANMLALVIREVRCLAQLDHPNCVRYYTSWLEPSWMTGDQNLNRSNFDDDEYLGSHIPQDIARPRPKLLTDIEHVVNGINKSDELEHTVEKLEAILYGSGIEEKSDGFDWTSNSNFPSNQLSAFSFDRTGEESSADWGNLPSRQTVKKPVYSLRSSCEHSGGEEDDSDVSEWTKNLDGGESRSSHWDSKHSTVHDTEEKIHSTNNESFHHVHSQMHKYVRQESLELERRPHRNATQSNEANGKRNHPSSTSSSPYKYQICLFIQMQLCHPMTLADWIKQRNTGCVRLNAEERQARALSAFNIFRQIVNGLEHIHSKGIIHRDLKPANIFAGDDDNWRIGDFGLSKMMREAHPGPLSPSSNEFFTSKNFVKDGHTAGVGTASYAAPEQITDTHYGPEVDIFALGMILLELFSNFTSEHERAKAFHNCRHRRELEPSLQRTYPEVSTLVLACTQNDRSRRPTTSDIQNAGVYHERGSCAEIIRGELSALRVEIAHRDSLIEKQKDLLDEKEREIQDLRRRLSEVGAGTLLQSNSARDDEVDEDRGCISSSDDTDY